MVEELKELQGYLEFAIKLAHEAGQNLFDKRENAKLLSVTDKGHKGLVSDADLANKELIVSTITKAFPDHGILSEEMEQEIKGTSEWLWVVDECDGTNNLLRGDPNFSVSIGLLRRGIGVLGVVFAPVLRRLYYAAEGQGAFVEEEGKKRPIHVSGPESLNMFTMSFGAGIDFNQPEKADCIVARIRKSGLFKNFRRRMLESTALELCFVAEGKFDAHFNNFARPWDIAAGMVIVQEAGGKVSKLGDEALLASNGVIHEGLVALTSSKGF